MPTTRDRLASGVVRGSTAAGISAGFQYLVGGGFNPYATGIILGASILDSLFSEDPPPPPPTRQQILFAEQIYKQWAFGYLPIPVRTLFGGSFRRERAGLPNKWVYGIRTASDFDEVARVKANEDIQGWSVLDIFGYLSHDQMEVSGVRGIFIDDYYVPLTNSTASDYGTNTPLYYPLGHPINGQLSNNFTGKFLVTPSFGRGDFPSLDASIDPADIYKYTTPAWGENFHQSNISYARISLIEELNPNTIFWTERGFPNNLRLLAEGIKVYDLSQYPDHLTAPLVWTDNAISIRYFFETRIAGLLDTDLDMSALLESYNAAEEIITYDWNAYDATNTRVINGQDIADYTDRMPRRGRRYSFNGIISTEQPNIRQIRDRLDFAANGRTVPSGTTLAILAGQNKAPVQVNGVDVHFRDEDFVENPQRIVQPDIDNAFNAIRVRYKSQLAAFDDREIVIQDTQAVARDGQEIVRRGVLAIEDAPSDVAVQGRVIGELVEHRNDRFVECIVIGIHVNIRIGDGVRLSSTALEINNRAYTVANRELNFNENTTKFVLRAQSDAYADRFVTPELETIPLAAPDEIATVVALAGVAGEDGQGFEYVFRLTEDDNAPALPANARLYDWSNPTDGWTDGAQPTTAVLPYLWLAIRTVPGRPDTDSTPTEDFGLWLGPIKIAEFEKDGQFQEFIFKATASDQPPALPVALDEENRLNNDFPEDWSDNREDLQVVTNMTPFVWMSYRTKNAGTQFDRLWSPYTPPVLLTIRELPPQQLYTYMPRNCEIVQYATFGDYERTGLNTENFAAFVAWTPTSGAIAAPPLPGMSFGNNPSIPLNLVDIDTAESQTDEIWELSALFRLFMRYKVKASDTNYGLLSRSTDPTNIDSDTGFRWRFGSPSEDTLRIIEQLGLPFEVWYTQRHFDATTGVWGDFESPTRRGHVDSRGYVPPGFGEGDVFTVEDGTPTWGKIEQSAVEDLPDDIRKIKERLDMLESGTTRMTNIAPTITAHRITQDSFALSWSGGSITTGTWTLQEFISGAWTTLEGFPGPYVYAFPSDKSAGTSYRYRVRRGTGPWAEITVTTLGTVAATPPTIASSNISRTGFTLSWSGGTITTGAWQLQEFVNNGWSTILSDATATNTVLSDRTAGTAYRFRIRRGDGPFAEIAVTTAAAPAVTTAPTISVATTRTTATVTYGGGSVTTGTWSVQYKQSDTVSWSSATGEGASSVTIPGLSPGTEYDFRVQRGSGPWATQTNISTQEAEVAAEAPNVEVTTTSTTATVTYMGGSVTTGAWRVQYRRSEFTGNVRLDTFVDVTGERAGSVTITDLRASTAYDFRVRRGTGPWATVTNISTKTPAPDVPRDVHAETHGRGADRIQWDWVQPLRGGATSYEYYLTTSSTAPTASTAATESVQTTSVQTRSLRPSTEYNLYVRAVNATGKSDWAGPATATTDALDAPILSGRPFFSNTRVLSDNIARGVAAWGAAVGNHYSYDWEILQVSDRSRLQSSRRSISDAQAQIVFSALNGAIFRVQAFNAAGRSDWIEGTIMVGNNNNSPGVRVQDQTTTSYTLLWSRQAGTSGLFQLEENVGGTWTPRYTGSRTFFGVTGKTANTLYRYRIKRGTGPWGEFNVRTNP